ncbi:MAG: hypothetical protein R2813_00610 [Flavobacteriales bacterium]
MIRTFLSFLLILISNCQPVLGQFNHRFELQNCYSGKYNGIDTLIHTNGYFTTGWDQNTKSSFFLYPDGFLVFVTFPQPFFEYDRNGAVVPTTGKPPEYILNHYFHSGNYIVCGDTIKLQYSSNPKEMGKYNTVLWYLIENKNTLSYLKPESYEKGWSNHTMNFKPQTNLPDPNQSWLKQKKWFWCDEQDFKSWKLSSH